MTRKSLKTRGMIWVKIVFISLTFLIALNACVSPQLDQDIYFFSKESKVEKQGEKHRDSENGPDRQKIRSSIGVAKFVDLRPRKGTSNAMTWIGFIPGVLYLELLTEIPDSHTIATDYNADEFRRAFARGIFRFLKNSDRFREVVYHPYEPYKKTHYRIEGVIHRTFLNETVYYYGSGLYAWVTRILGLPYVSYEFEIDLELRLRNTKNDEIIWNYRLHETGEDRNNSIYRLSSGIEEHNVISYNISRLISRHSQHIESGIARAIARDR